MNLERKNHKARKNHRPTEHFKQRNEIINEKNVHFSTGTLLNNRLIFILESHHFVTSSAFVIVITAFKPFIRFIGQK